MHASRKSSTASSSETSSWRFSSRIGRSGLPDGGVWRVYGRRDPFERVPCAAVTDASSPPVGDVDTVLPWRRRRARDTVGFLSPRVRRLAAEGSVDVSAL